MDRRDFLKLGATGLLGGAGCGATTLQIPESVTASRVDFFARHDRPPLTPSAIAALDERHAEFPLGVMSGDALQDRVIVWTRFIGRGVLVLWIREIGSDARMQIEVPTGPDGFTHVEVTGLSPGRRYRYVFLVRDRGGIALRGPSGRFRTALAVDALEPVTFAGTSCTNQYVRPYPALAHAAMRRDLDFFLHAGDHVYADFSYSLADYRTPYSLAWPAYGMKALHAGVGMYATWDDHEVGNNWDPETWDRQRVAAARRAFFEHHPIRRHTEDPQRMWRSFRWGRTLELFVLDARSERRPSTRTTRNAQYLSRAQMEWLQRGLAASDARFKVILNSVPITNFPGVYDWFGADRWEGYPAAREEILSFIVRARIQGVWWLSGDFHFGCVARLEPSGPYSAMREVLMGPGRQHINVVWNQLSGSQWDVLLGRSNYTLFRADPLRDTMSVAFVGENGETLAERVFPR